MEPKRMMGQQNEPLIRPSAPDGLGTGVVVSLVVVDRGVVGVVVVVDLLGVVVMVVVVALLVVVVVLAVVLLVGTASGLTTTMLDVSLSQKVFVSFTNVVLFMMFNNKS